MVDAAALTATCVGSDVPDTTLELARQLRDLLSQRAQRIVLAESCTAGRIAATLSVLPGISQWLCGSFVVYRNASKTAWLGVPESLLDDPRFGPVSREASRALASAALQHTSEADWSIAITGDVGPGASPATDGMIFLACAAREQTTPRPENAREERICLAAPAPRDAEDIRARLTRLQEATEHALQFAIQQVIGRHSGDKC